MAYESKIEEHKQRSERAVGMGGPERLAKRKAEGKLNARERIGRLLDPESFFEEGRFSTSARREDAHKTPQDGQVTGFGKIEGRTVAVHANDLTVMSSSSAEINSRKSKWLLRAAVKAGAPYVHLGACGGARMPDSMGASGMAKFGFTVNFDRRRVVPMITGIADPSFGGSFWLAARSDIVVMRKGAVMAVSSPKVTQVAISEKLDAQELGGWEMHTSVTGMCDLAVDTEEQMLDAIRRYLSYLPSHQNEAPPRAPVPAGSGSDLEKVLDLVPESRAKVYDVRKVIAAFVDRDSFFPIKERYGKAVVTGFARLDGHPVAIAACNPLHKGGAQDADSTDKYTNMIVLADSFNLPIIILCDTPGFLIGREGERQKVGGKIMNNLQALELTTVPKIAIILRKSYGQAYLNFGGGTSDDFAAWFGSEISFVDPSIGVSVVHNLRYEDDPERYKALAAEMSKDTSAYDLASIFASQHVIDPRDTRKYLIQALDVHRLRRSSGIGEHLMSTWPQTL